MGVWPMIGPVTPVMISAVSPYATGLSLAATSTSTPSAASVANEARLFPFILPEGVEVRKLFCQIGATPPAHLDVGIYTDTFNLITSTGSVAGGSANALQEFDITDLILDGMTPYYMAMVTDDTGTTLTINCGTVRLPVAAGWCKMATAFPLPATITPVLWTSLIIPLFGLSLRDLVA